MELLRNLEGGVLAAVAVGEGKRVIVNQFGGCKPKPLDRLQHRSRFRQEPLARWCERDPSAGPFKEGEAKFGLEFLNALRERRSRHVESCRGPAEMLFLGDSHEIAESA